MSVNHQPRPAVSVTTNACKLCTPLGACLAFRGIEGTVPLLHGSQGCSTYIRRYIISHFKEPIDVASSNFSESSAIFGGGVNLATALQNVTAQYHPELIAVASTCLSETIGDDVPLFIRQYRREHPERPPEIIHVSTPSYRGTHMDGFHAAVRAAVDELAEAGAPERRINLFPGLVSPADLRHLKEIMADFGVDYTLLPDYSETLDGEIWQEYQKIAPGGTPLAAIRRTGRAMASFEFSGTIAAEHSTGNLLKERFGISYLQTAMPIGVRACDQFFTKLAEVSGNPIPDCYRKERGRLVDSYVDGHKYIFGKRAVLYGEEDLVVSLAGFLAEIGVIPVLCASGGESGRLAEAVQAAAPEVADRITVRDGADFMDIAELAEKLQPDLIVGNSKGYPLARKLQIPLIRVGFPIHDRLGGQRLLHLGYRGTQALFDRIVNAVIERQQDASPVGYSYM
ncbi:nitrogenase molybdenum-iron protein NifN [Hydrogenispora ethanolica]|jgi:nitrogenase molybdenum-iron protein NifN|uniref:Nitrogenase molybdenum-iron protein NifN n=1 Tax=Hydrogenispora ethanolica TaxID=1082276 RepID=A0A4R1RF74_HYDET|nr:nitrogenase component 1 [Hydrogenispora ethanolica]TCL64222.1 nitrogenase molybdenum-iron protein NifN [Hydrogenispora ethanolica]